jgi:hypothetical protein
MSLSIQNNIDENQKKYQPTITQQFNIVGMHLALEAQHLMEIFIMLKR